MPSRTAKVVAYSYLRFSSPEQAKGASKRRQIEAARRWATEHDLTLDESLRDEGVSAYKGRQRDPTSALGNFLARVQAGEITRGSFLLVESFDRLSREEVTVALELFLGLTRAGITIVTLADGRIYDRASLKLDSTQLILSIVVMARAFEESQTKSQRVGDAWARKRNFARDKKQAMTARCPGWLKLVGGPKNGQYQLIDSHAEIIRDVFSWTISGDGRRTIAKRLNARGVPTWGSGRSRAVFWQDSYIAKILTSPAVHGVFVRSDGERIEGYFPTVVTQDVFWAAQAAMRGRSSGAGRTARNFANLLFGMASCRRCGGSMVYVNKGSRSRPALRCSTAHAGGDCSMRGYVPYQEAELDTLFAYAHLEDRAVFATNEAARDAMTSLERLHAEKADLEARTDRLLQAIEDGAPSSQVHGRLDALRLRLDAVGGEIAEASAIVTRTEEVLPDLESRVKAVIDQLSVVSSDEIYQARANLNARLRRFIRRVIIAENGHVVLELLNGDRDVRTEMVGAALSFSPPEQLSTASAMRAATTSAGITST